MSETEQQLQELTNAVLAGRPDEVRQSTYAALARGGNTNDVLDALVEAVNIVVDLHQVEEYAQEKLAAAEAAVTSCIETLEDRLVKSESRFNFKATVGPVGLKAGSILSLALTAVLRSVGFKAINLGKTQTPLELLRNSEELGADLVVPLLATDGVEGQLRTFLEETERGGFREKFQIIPVAPGFPDVAHSPLDVARNSTEAISKAMEWALKRLALEKSE